MQRRPFPLAPSIAAGLLLGTSALALGATPPGMGLSVEGAPAPALIRAIEQPVVENRRFAAGPAEHFELLFTDGTSLTLAPGTALTVERYSWDGATGALAIRLEAGLLRVAGGRLNRSASITLTSGSCSLDVEDASAVIATGPAGDVRAYMLVGGRVTLASGGSSEALVRPMYQTRAACSGDAPMTASRVEQAQVQADAFALNPSLAVLAGLAVEPAAGEGETEEVVLIADDPQIDHRTIDRDDGDNGGNGGGETQRVQRGTLDTTTGFSPDRAGRSINVGGTGSPLFGDNSIQILQQQNYMTFAQRSIGPTANRLFSQSDMSQLLDQWPPQSLRNPIAYGIIGTGDIYLDPLDELGIQHYIFRPSDSNITFQSKLYQRTELMQEREGGPLLFSRPLLFQASHSSVYLTGFSREPGQIRFDRPNAIDRGPDNFVAIQVAPAMVSERFIDRLREDYSFVDGSFIDNTIIDNFPSSISANGILTRFPLTGFSVAEVVDEDNFVKYLLEGDFEKNTVVQPDQVRDFIIFPTQENLDFDHDKLAEAVAEALSRPTQANGVDPSRPERFFFAAGDVDGPYEPSFVVEQFFVSAGLEDDAQSTLKKVLESDQEDVTTSIVDGIRAFLRNESAFGSGDGLGIPLADSGVMIISHAEPAVDVDGRSLIAQVLHADFGLENSELDNGAGEERTKIQRSTISLTLGTLERYPVPEPDGSVSHDAELNARTLATSQAGDGEASVFVTSPLRSTAAGGGNSNLPGPDKGKVGYLVVENYIPEHADPLHGGLERPLGAAESGYAVLRLLTGKETVAVDPNDRRSRALDGHAAGLLEALGSNGVNVFFADGWDGSAVSGNLDLSTNRDGSTVTGSLRLSNSTDGSFEMLLGDRSAFVDDSWFAAMSEIGEKGSGFGLVTASLLADADGRLGDLGTLPTYKKADALGRVGERGDAVYHRPAHLQWGFFFGDQITGQANGQDLREHVQLGSWVAGKLIHENEAWSGTGSYAGHVVGNVLSDGKLSTERGSFTNEWNFTARSGNMRMDFDNAIYRGTTRNPGTQGFSGNLAGADLAGADNARTATVSGSFYGATTVGDRDLQPAAIGGQFNISGENYGAAGTFAGDRD